MILTRRPAADRGQFDHGWLQTAHSFSFADYVDRRWMGFHALRVINEDVIAPSAGFPTHGHSDMEIITYVLSGALEHRDSTGGHGVIRRGEIQHMSAGSGIYHSEFNASETDPVHLLQIWLRPLRRGLTPGYRQTEVADASRRNQLYKIAAPDDDRQNSGLPIATDVALYSALLAPGVTVSHALAPGRAAWIQVALGTVEVNGELLGPGDGLGLEQTDQITITASSDTDLLLFDLA